MDSKPGFNARKVINCCNDLLKSACRYLAVKMLSVDWTWTAHELPQGRELARPAVTRLQIFTLDGDDSLDPKDPSRSHCHHMFTKSPSPTDSGSRAREEQKEIDSSIDWGNR